MSIEMKITGANPAEIAAHITGLYGMLHIGKMMTAAMADAPTAAAKPDILEEVARVEKAVDQLAAEAPKKRGRPAKEPAPVVEAKVEQPEAQIDLEEAIAATPEPPKEVDEPTVRTAIIELANQAKKKAAPNIEDITRKAVGAAYQEFDDAGVARGLPKIAEFKLMHVTPDRRAEFLGIIERRTAAIVALADGTWTGA